MSLVFRDVGRYLEATEAATLFGYSSLPALWLQVCAATAAGAADAAADAAAAAAAAVLLCCLRACHRLTTQLYLLCLLCLLLLILFTFTDPWAPYLSVCVTIVMLPSLQSNAYCRVRRCSMRWDSATANSSQSSHGRGKTAMVNHRRM